MKSIMPLLAYMILPSKLRVMIVTATMMAVYPVDCTNPFTGAIIEQKVPAVDIVNYFDDGDDTEQPAPKEQPADDDVESDYGAENG